MSNFSKVMISNAVAVLICVCYLSFILSVPVGVIYSVYLLGPAGMATGVALWGGVMLVGKVLVAGAVSGVCGVFLFKKYEHYM